MHFQRGAAYARSAIHIVVTVDSGPAHQLVSAFGGRDLHSSPPGKRHRKWRLLPASQGQRVLLQHLDTMGSGRDGSATVQGAPGPPAGRASLDKPSLQNGGYGAAQRMSVEAKSQQTGANNVLPPALPEMQPGDEAWAAHEPVTEVRSSF